MVALHRHLLRLLHGADAQQPGARLRDHPPGAGRVRAAQPAAGGGGDGRPAGWRRRSCRSRWGRASAPSGSIERDEHPRPETTMEDLAKLPTAFDKDGFVTAGNASGIVDGAAMLLLTTGRARQEPGPDAARPHPVVGRGGRRAVAHGHRSGAGHPRRARRRPGIELDDLDLFEINEAFAGQILAVRQGARPRRGQAQRQRRRDRARPSAGRHGRAHHR